MKTILYPPENTWEELLARPAFEQASLFETVSGIFSEVKQKGDTALLGFAKKFDGVALESLLVCEEEFVSCKKQISEELKTAIKQAYQNITVFHKAQLKEESKIETQPGVVCWRKNVGIEKVGLYIPGGSAPLFSTVLMLAIPAKLANCKEVVLCTPPNKQGKVHPAIVFTAKLCGVTKIVKAGGAQAIAALTVGTETVPKVSKVFGPGNQYVTAAKQYAQLQGVAIDMPAGPSEVAVIADETANPAFVAADLLSQAEHGADSQVILFTTNTLVAEAVSNEVAKQIAVLPRKETAEKALENSKCIVVKNDAEVMTLVNEYAPEHLIINTKNYNELAEQVVNAGSVFLGQYTCESAGDYASGTNHTLPTNGYAKAYSGVSVDSFLKKITFQEISKEGIQNIGKTIEIMAEAEELLAHKNAVTLRLNN
jgi:histidinol dehydrogenase